MEKYFLDKRILVNGRKSHIYLDNFIDLSEYIQDVIAAYPPYTFQNGLTESPTFTVELGGTLLHDTTIDGANLYDFKIDNIDEFRVRNTGKEYVLALGNHTGITGVNAPMAGLYRAYNSNLYNVGHYIDTKSSISYAISSFNYLSGVNYIRSRSTHGPTKTTIEHSTNDGTIRNSFLEVKDDEIVISAVNVSAVSSETITLNNADLKGISFSGVGYQYYFPNSNGVSGEVLTEDGSGDLYWSNINPVLYFDNNPSNTTFLVDGGSASTISSYVLPANSLLTDGSYIEIEITVSFLGTIGASPRIIPIIDGVTPFNTSYATAATRDYIQTTNYKIYKISSTNFLFKANTTIAESSGLGLETRYRQSEQTLTGTFNDPITIQFDVNVAGGPGSADFIAELKYISITKFLK